MSSIPNKSRINIEKIIILKKENYATSPVLASWVLLAVASMLEACSS
jgi:hypothetical protein